MITSTIKIQTIGKLLKEEREKKNLSLRQISNQTKIRVEYLQALEEGNYSIFPSEVYIKGFLKNYAKFLKIDKEKALALYRRENKILDKEKLKKSNTLENKLKFDNLFTPERVVLMIIAIIFFAIFYYLANQVSVVLRSPELEIKQPIVVSAGQSNEFSTDEESITIKGSVSPGATLSLNGDEVRTNNLEQFEVLGVALSPGINQFKLIAESEFGRKTEINLIVNRIGQDELANDGTTTLQTNEMKLDLEIIEERASVRVFIDEEEALNQVFEPGETITLMANSIIELQTPRPANVKAKINGTEYAIDSTKLYTWELKDDEIILKL